MGALVGVQVDFGEAGFVVDFNGGSVFHGPLDVVDVDVVAEDLLGVFVGGFDGGAGKANEGGVGQGISQVFGEAVGGVGPLLAGFFVSGFDHAGFEAVLGAVGLIGNEDDVAALGEGFVLAAPFVGGELLDSGEDDAAGGHLQLGLEVGPVCRLLGGSAAVDPDIWRRWCRAGRPGRCGR